MRRLLKLSIVSPSCLSIEKETGGEFTTYKSYIESLSKKEAKALKKKFPELFL